ncbi:MAG: hypothetical protein H2172_18480 [Opitutus sp.]|nr:hypothetical protein [Opitutus sp.]MCS6274845.1 hypothetical protein [Opitutus sp.]MCS6278398.1 hypothetical protein [Opitutus sp.]MCS6299508.1 hypothetical protein [Opitutus sp.]
MGAADRYGYAVWHVPLASLSLNGTNIPLRAEFTTDPRPEPSPSPLGKGWSVNLFASALVEVDQDSIRWHRPDGRIFYFILERGNASTKKPNPDAPIVFKSKDDTWLALKTPRKRLVTLRHQESGAELVYEEGLLTRFTFAKSTTDTDQYLISYNRLRRPTRLTLRGSGKVIAEFVYDDANRAKEFRIGDAGDPLSKVISFEYAEASLNKFPTGPYLSKLGDAALTPLAISYAPQGGDANRIQFERINSTEISYLTWHAPSGFIRDDQGSTYKIENPSLANAGRPVLDPEAKPAEIPEGQRGPTKVADYNWRPDEAKVTRTDREGKSEYTYYDRAKGISTKMSKDGIKTVTHYLLTPGAMHGKIRKIERIQDNKILIVERNAYDELGRRIRQIDLNGNVIIWEYLNNGDFTRKIANGKITQELIYEQGKLVKNVIFKATGTEEYRYTYENNRKIAVFLENDIESWRKTYIEGLGIVEYVKSTGERYSFNYKDQGDNKAIEVINELGLKSILK